MTALNGLRVLVAEDNLVNQMVIKAQLKKFGIVPCIVVNGQEALAQLDRDRYDVLLLDCNMPVMDGFTTARRVRQVEQRNGSRLQIIALTANVFPETEAECFDAGMDAFLPKPLDIARLADILQQASGTSASEDCLDPTVIEALRTLGDHEHDILRELIGIYIAQSLARLQDIYIAAAAHDKLALANALHNLHGSSLTLGASRLAEMLQRFEMEAERLPMPDLDTALAELRTELEKVSAAMRRLI